MSRERHEVGGVQALASVSKAMETTRRIDRGGG
jgi:hypothetical protein